MSRSGDSFSGAAVPGDVTGVVGVDFSGADRPAEAVWITEARLSDGDLVVEGCHSARAAFDARERETVLDALVDRVLGADVAGLDFPFGLPRAVVEDLVGPEQWRATVAWVGGTFGDAGAFADRCKEAARTATGGDRTYLRRVTDDPVGAKSPYHFFTYKQAYHGTTQVLEPLLADGATVAPMTREDADGATEDRPTVIETYPAGTLRRLELPDENYKSTSDAARERRATILRGLERRGSPGDDRRAADEGDPEATPRVVVDGDDRERALSDDGGDALDSLVAAVGTARAVRRGFAVEADRYDPLEGYVYV